jgi:uncharacterized protein (TIGR02594 family)
MSLSQKAIEVALTQLGVHEDPGNKNTGPQVNEYLKSVGLNPGYSWCMAFVYWCFKQAAVQLAVDNPMAKTAGVMDQWNRRRLHYGQMHPMPGDVFIMDFGKGLGHTGLVEKADDKYIYTIEGNSNDEGSREGYEVCKRRRTTEKIKGYLRFG